jgi:hypothetical protein
MLHPAVGFELLIVLDQPTTGDKQIIELPAGALLWHGRFGIDRSVQVAIPTQKSC